MASGCCRGCRGCIAWSGCHGGCRGCVAWRYCSGTSWPCVTLSKATSIKLVVLASSGLVGVGVAVMPDCGRDITGTSDCCSPAFRDAEPTTSVASGMAGELAPGDGRASERGLGYFQVDCYCEAFDPKYVFVEPWAQGPCPCLYWLWRWVLLKLWGQLFGCSQKLPCNDSACKESNSMTMSIECCCEKLQGEVESVTSAY